MELARVVPDACGTVWAALKALGITGAGRHVAVYRGGPCDDFDMEIGVELAAPVGRHGEVYDSVLPAGSVATTTHLGPYGQLGRAHDAIRAWCAANGRTVSGPNWELYGHWIDAWNDDPSKIRTDVFCLLDA